MAVASRDEERLRHAFAAGRPEAMAELFTRHQHERLAFDELRKARRRNQFVPGDADLGEEGGPRDETVVDPLDGLIREERMAELRAAVASLPAELRAVLYLFSIDEMTAAEIAESRGEPVGTIYRRLHQARQILRWKLGEGRDCSAEGSFTRRTSHVRGQKPYA